MIDIKAPKTHQQVYSANLVLAFFVIGIAVGASRGKCNRQLMRQGPAEQTVQFQCNASITFTNF